MKKRKAILVGSADRSRVKKRRRRIGTFTSAVAQFARQKLKAMTPWERMVADVSKL